MKQLTFEQQRVRNWVIKNRGALSAIAVKHRISQQFVSKYAYGRSTAVKGHPIEADLYRAGWPGIARTK